VPLWRDLGPHLTQYGLGRGLPPYTKWHLDPTSRLATTDMAENWGCALFWGELGPHLTQCHLGRGLPPYQWHLDPISRLPTTYMG